MPDPLSSARGEVVGVDLVAGQASVGSFVRGSSTPSTVAQTATGALAGVEVAGEGTARLDLVTSAYTGSSPSLTVTIETSFDNGVTDAWRSVAAFSAQTAAGTARKVFAGLDRWVRANVSAFAGTSVTFSLSGEVV